MDMIAITLAAATSAVVNKGGKDIVGILVPTACPAPGAITIEGEYFGAPSGSEDWVDLEDSSGSWTKTVAQGKALIFGASELAGAPADLKVTCANSITGTFYLLCRDFQ